MEQKTNFSIVSNGADVILIDQQFYLKHAPEKLISKMRQEVCHFVVKCKKKNSILNGEVYIARFVKSLFTDLRKPDAQ